MTFRASPRRKPGSIMHILWIPASAGMTALTISLLSGTCLATDNTGKDLCRKNYASYKDRIARAPSDDAAWTELRVCTIELKNWDEAIQVALQARQKNRDLPQPYLIMGLAQMQQKNYERAIEHFDQTIALKSEQPLAYFQMGMAFLFLNEPAKAAEAAARAAELDPSNSAHHRQLAYAELLLGDYPSAESAAKKAIALDKEDFASHKILAKIYAKEGNTAGMTEELAFVKKSEGEYAAAHPDLVKKPEPALAKPKEEEETEEKPGKVEDYQVIGQCIDQWNQMKDSVLQGNTEGALAHFSDYLDTREQYRESFKKLGLPRMMAIFGGFGELYDCEVVFASAHCKALVKNAAGNVVAAKIRFERNPDHNWRIRSF